MTKIVSLSAEREAELHSSSVLIICMILICENSLGVSPA